MSITYELSVRCGISVHAVFQQNILRRDMKLKTVVDVREIKKFKKNHSDKNIYVYFIIL